MRSPKRDFGRGVVVIISGSKETSWDFCGPGTAPPLKSMTSSLGLECTLCTLCDVYIPTFQKQTKDKYYISML